MSLYRHPVYSITKRSHQHKDVIGLVFYFSLRPQKQCLFTDVSWSYFLYVCMRMYMCVSLCAGVVHVSVCVTGCV